MIPDNNIMSIMLTDITGNHPNLDLRCDIKILTLAIQEEIWLIRDSDKVYLLKRNITRS